MTNVKKYTGSCAVFNMSVSLMFKQKFILIGDTTIVENS